jgi:hypothetical protein
MLQRAEEARRIMQEKAFKSYRYATEEDVRGFHNYRREADFISLESMSVVKIMEGSTYMRLYLTLAQILQIQPCDIRLWSIDSVEKTCNQRVNKQLSLEELQDSYIDHNKFYVEDLFGALTHTTLISLPPCYCCNLCDYTLVKCFITSVCCTYHVMSYHILILYLRNNAVCLCTVALLCSAAHSPFFLILPSLFHLSPNHFYSPLIPLPSTYPSSQALTSRNLTKPSP